MKLIMENWRGYLNEEEVPQEPTPEQIELVHDFLEDVFAVLAAAEDVEAEEETGRDLAEGSAVRKGRMARKTRIHRTKEIKKLANLADVKLKDFTPDQQHLYDDAKRQYSQMEQDSQDQMAHSTLHGDMLSVPAIKSAFDAGGGALRTALSLVLMAPECRDNFNVTCLAQNYLEAYMKYGAPVGKRDDI